MALNPSSHLHSSPYSKMADSLYKSVIKKFSFQPKVWISYLEFLMKDGRREAARAVMERSFKSLQKAQRELSLSHSSLLLTHAQTHTHTHTQTHTCKHNDTTHTCVRTHTHKHTTHTQTQLSHGASQSCAHIGVLRVSLFVLFCTLIQMWRWL